MAMESATLQRRAQGAAVAWGVCTLAVGLAMSAGVALQARAREDRAIESRFQADAAGWMSRVSTESDLFFDVLNSIRVLHSISDSISESAFEEFVSKGMLYQRQVLGVFGFARLVGPTERSTFERAAAGTNTADVILERSGAEGFKRARERDVYFPMTFAHPADALDFPVGYDFASEPLDRLAIERMLQSGSAVLGREVAATERGLLAFSPILYQAFDPNRKAYFLAQGFAFAVFRPATILRSALPAEAAGVVTVELSPFAQAARAAASDEPVFEDSIQIAGEPWLFRCHARPGYMESRRSAQPVILFSAGSCVSALLAVLIAQMVGRTKRIEALVRERTTALQEANRRLEEERAECLRLENEILNISSAEKQRVGQDLHDSLGQKLAGAVFAGRALAGNPTLSPDVKAETERLVEITKDAVSQVRRMARGLAPVEIGEQGLSQALRRLAEETCEVYGVVCAFTQRGHVAPRDASTAMHLYHIAQEGVTNAMRHGEAREIRIDLGSSDDLGLLTISDNGKGIAPESSRGTGLGLRIMKYRASMFGGSVEVKAATGGGTLIECRFPKFSTTNGHE